MAKVIRELIEAAVLALLVFLVIQVSVQNFRVKGQSMQPSLDGGEYLMVSKLLYFQLDVHRLARLIPFWDVEEDEKRFVPFAHPPERGDVIVFHSPTTVNQEFVKRVVGLPGEKVVIEGGRVLIDGVPLEEPYLDVEYPGISMGCIPKTAGCTLGPNQYFALGDNRDNSTDSKDWGPVPEENIIGKVWFIYWPLSRIPFL